jgi:YVTN family beta-propeller protein
MMNALWRNIVLTTAVIAGSFCFATQQAAADEKAVAYVSNQDGGVTIISLDSMTKIGEFAGGGNSPRGIGVTADGKYVLTANRDSGDMSVFDAATKKLVKRIPIGQNPEFVRVFGGQAYVTYEPSSKAGPPGQAEKDDDDDKAETLPAGIAVVDLKDFKVLRTIMSGPETEGLEFSADGKVMLVTNEGDNTITVYSLPDGKQVKRIDTTKQGARPRGIKISPDGQLYAVTLEYGDKLMIMDRDFKPLKTLQTGKTPYGVAFDRDGKRLFVAASRAKQLQVFDAKSFELIKNVPTGDRCWHFTFTPDDSKILLACGKSNETIVIDARTYAVDKKIGELKTPWGVVTYPKALGSLDAP